MKKNVLTLLVCYLFLYTCLFNVQVYASDEKDSLDTVLIYEGEEISHEEKLQLDYLDLMNRIDETEHGGIYINDARMLVVNEGSW